jgi:TRAP-type C4-dicarboxylate transport system permease small subunit
MREQTERTEPKVDGLHKVVYILDKVGIFSRWSNVIGVAGFFIMICLTFVDVIMRYIFHSPIRYVTEMVEVMMITSIFLAIAHTQNEKGHVSVDVITSKLKSKARLFVEVVTLTLSLGIWAIIIWQNAEEIQYVLAHNVVHTQSFLISKAPFLAIIVIGSLCLWLLVLRDLLLKIDEARKLRLGGFQWLLMAALPIAALGLVGLWAQPALWDTSLTSAGLIGGRGSYFVSYGYTDFFCSLIDQCYFYDAHPRF